MGTGSMKEPHFQEKMVPGKEKMRLFQEKKTPDEISKGQS
jgi:hypothetical protein